MTKKTKEELERQIARLEDAIACAENDEELDGETSDPVEDWRCELADLREELRDRFGVKI